MSGHKLVFSQARRAALWALWTFAAMALVASVLLLITSIGGCGEVPTAGVRSVALSDTPTDWHEAYGRAVPWARVWPNGSANLWTKMSALAEAGFPSTYCQPSFGVAFGGAVPAGFAPGDSVTLPMVDWASYSGDSLSGGSVTLALDATADTLIGHADATAITACGTVRLSQPMVLTRNR